MRNEIIFMVEESAEGGMEASALGHSIYTEADTFEELRGSVRDALSPVTVGGPVTSAANMNLLESSESISRA